MPFLSVVIPAFNEEARIGRSLERVCAFLARQPWESEVLVVDNASTDGTRAVVEAFAQTSPAVVLLCEARRGKGAAVRTGMLAARGEYALFSDADLSTPIEEAGQLLEALPEGYDVAIASRALAASRLPVRQPWRRELMGRLFNQVVRALAVPAIADTQCGFKLFRREVARELFGRQTIAGWAFDVEILFLARRLGYRVAELPVTWANSPQSKVNMARDLWGVLRDMLGIRWKALRGAWKSVV